jgi:hypothetical protein
MENGMNAPAKDRSTRLRASIARGIVGKVDFEKGIIHGIAINTEGPALGHGYSLDREFVEAVVEGTNAKKMGIKARFGLTDRFWHCLGLG